MPYKPMMPKKEQQRRIAHQERVFLEGQRRRTEKVYKIDERKIRVTPSVFEPHYPSPLTDAVLYEVKESDRVLDVGTGSGINAILAASRSSDILAIDINPYAVKCAKSNVKLNGLSSCVKVIKSDLFERVDGEFDLIIIDPPFRWTKPRSWLEKASADERYETLDRFFSEVKSHLSTRGRIILNFGTSADMKYLRHLIRKNGFNYEVMSKVRNRRVGWTYYVFKLTTKQQGTKTRAHTSM